LHAIRKNPRISANSFKRMTTNQRTDSRDFQTGMYRRVLFKKQASAREQNVNILINMK